MNSKFSKNKKKTSILIIMFLCNSIIANSEVKNEFLLLGTYFRDYSRKAENKERKNKIIPDNPIPDQGGDNDIKPDPVPTPDPNPDIKPDPSPVVYNPFPVVLENNVVKAEKNKSGDLVEYRVSGDISAAENEGLRMTDKNTKVYNDKSIYSDSNYSVLVENEAYFENNGTIRGKNAGVKLSGNSKMVNNSLIQNTGNIGVEVSEASLFINNGTVENGKNYGISVNGEGSEAVNGKNGVIQNGNINNENTGLVGMYITDGATGRNEGMIKNTSHYGMYVIGAGSTAINEAGGIIKNGGVYNPDITDSGGMQAVYGGTVINKGKIETVDGYGMVSVSEGSEAVNDVTGIIANTASNGMYAEAKGRVTNFGVIKNEQNGIYVTDTGSVGVNEKTGVIENSALFGMHAVSEGAASNKGTIQNTSNYGMYAEGKKSTVINEAGAVIKNTGDYGMAAADGGNAYNYGTIQNTGNYGMDISGASIGVNSGTIHLTGNNKTGVSVSNSNFTNNGIIILEGENSIGIKAQTSTITLTPNSVITLTNGTATDTVTSENTDFASKGAGNTSSLGKFYLLDDKSTLINGGSIVGKTVSIQGEGKFILDSKTGKIKSDTLNLESNMYVNSNKTLDSSGNSYTVNNLAVNNITGNGKIVSDSKVFTADTSKNNEGYTVTLKRNNFQDVYSGDLGRVLENNYAGSENNQDRNKVYNALKQISNDKDLQVSSKELTAQTLTGNQAYQQYTQNKMINNAINAVLAKRDTETNGTYVNFFGSSSNIENYDDINGYDSKTSGVLLGGMKKITDKTALGGFLGYANAEYNYKDSKDSQQNSDTWILSGAGEYKITPNLKWTSIATYTRGDNDTERKITYDKSNTLLTGGFYSWSMGGSSVLEYNQRVNSHVTLKPVIGAVFDYIKQDSYSEKGGLGLNTEAYSGFSAKAETGLGADLTVYENNTSKFKVQPKILYTYELGSPYSDKTVKIQNFNGNIQTESRKADRNDVNLGLDLQYMYKDNLSIYAGYESGVISDNRTETVTAGVKVTFK